MITSDKLKGMNTGDAISDATHDVLCVPGGWIYTNKKYSTSVFVPMPGIYNRIEVDIDDDDIEKLTTVYGDPNFKIGG